MRIGVKMGWMKKAFGPEDDRRWEHGKEWDEVARGEEAEDAMGKIVEHNEKMKAKLSGGGKSSDEDRYAARKIIEEAENSGHEGLRVNANGMIVKTTVIEDWVGRGDHTVEEAIGHNTKPHSRWNWEASVSNNPNHLQ